MYKNFLNYSMFMHVCGYSVHVNVQVNLFHNFVQLKADASLCVVMSAYNTISDNWEPVLEPMVVEKDDVQYYPWTLQMTVSISVNWLIH